MADDLKFPPEWEDIGELVLFLSKEAVALRSFLNYLRTDDGTPPEVKMDHSDSFRRSTFRGRHFAVASDYLKV